MNWPRILTGFIIVLVTFLFVAIGGLAFSLAVACVSIVSLWEFYKLIIKDMSNFGNLLLSSIGILYAAIIVLIAHKYGTLHLPIILLSDVVIAAFLSLCLFKNNFNIPVIVVKQLAGLVYIPVALSLLVVMRNSNFGLYWCLMVLCLVAAGDIGAYYVGSFLGRHKLSKDISPKKTIEGSFAGLFCNIIVVIGFKIYLINFISVFQSVLFACVVGVAGQVGDLFVSEFKRIAGVKDSGIILPGHGGILDRIDALLLALPMAYFFHLFIIQ